MSSPHFQCAFFFPEAFSGFSKTNPWDISLMSSHSRLPYLQGSKQFAGVLKARSPPVLRAFILLFCFWTLGYMPGSFGTPICTWMLSYLDFRGTVAHWLWSLVQMLSACSLNFPLCLLDAFWCNSLPMLLCLLNHWELPMPLLIHPLILKSIFSRVCNLLWTFAEGLTSCLSQFLL